ncbi:ribbon-helix-helix domain-containing protein [Candidatus Woesearchaeota archaeon]|nr:ribbon-helix-helix domain-containing protein [Candidatus Woesearchaeota archaeon]
MDAITLKLDENMLANVDESLKNHNYSTRTEFIRDAIRDKLEGLKREELMAEFLQYRGKAKKKTTYAENRKIREEVSRELMAELDKKFR